MLSTGGVNAFVIGIRAAAHHLGTDGNAVARERAEFQRAIGEENSTAGLHVLGETG